MVGAMVTVKDNPEQGRYDAFVDGKLAGHTNYSTQGDHVVFSHTEVAPEFGGKGVASTLIKAALDDMRSKGNTIDPKCPFVRGFIDKHAEYADLIASKP
jgi:predicted GNAT family acetyltransferase